MLPSFAEILQNGEQQLLDRILSDAEANGRFGPAPPDPEEWRPTVRGLSGSIVQAFRASGEPSPPASGEPDGGNGLTAFMVVEARKHRLDGMPLGTFLGLMKLIRRAYADQVRSAGCPPDEEGRYLLFVERFFDRNEMAACVSWATESNREQEEALVGMRDELARVHALVETAKEELEGTIDCLDTMIVLAGVNGRILRCNRAFKEFAGKPFREIVGRPLARTLEECGLPSELSGKEAVERYHERLGRWLVLRRYPFRGDPERETSGSIVTIRDTTEIRNAAADLERGTARLKDALSGIRRTQAKLVAGERMAAAAGMAAGAARDIGRPIGVVVGNLTTLAKLLPVLAEVLDVQSSCIAAGSPPRLVEAARRKREETNVDYILKDLRDLVSETLEEAERAGAVVAGLARFSRTEETEFRPADVNECLRDAILLVRDELKGRVTLDRRLETLPPTRCVPARLTRAFADLLSDAARHARVPGVVRVRSWLADGYVRVSVGDAAREIPKDRLAHVFEPFSPSGDDERDTGLGLSAAFDTVRKHGGEIRVRSGPGKGTTFTVSVPLVKER
jgi:signal transduction histidine kinase